MREVVWDENEEEEDSITHDEGGRQGAIERETSSVPEGVSPPVDRGGVCGVGGETRWKRGGLQSLGMGRHAHKRHVLRRGPSESHDRRR